MQSRRVGKTFRARLLARLRRTHSVRGPVRVRDGVCRLRPVSRWPELAAGVLPLIPLKRFLLPPRDELWTLAEGAFAQPAPDPPVALVGIPPCDLHGLGYLDLVFDEDALYRRRREKLFMVGSSCVPGPECFCPPRREPPPFDLFLDEGRVWSGTPDGDQVLADLSKHLGDPEDLPLPEAVLSGVGDRPAGDLEGFYRASAGDPLWREVGERCVCCGACSAVCPTCYCYDVVDEAIPGKGAIRIREWDNCFFRAHALVAGGQNFRPSRAERLRFRFEHKMLGFGPLRGVPSCVGCGRCRRACPVGSGISEVLERLVSGGAP